jgi:photosystem II stability/assembly factor-like uncharacterized protein
MPEYDLEWLYREAQSALKVKDYTRASELLRQILVTDENYKDVSRLLAQTVILKRRKWYNDIRLWGTLGIVLLIGLGFFSAPKILNRYAIQPSVTVTVGATMPSTTATAISTSTAIPIPPATPIALQWKRISIGQEFQRNEITSIVQDPNDQDVLYLGTNNAGIYRSINRGESWQPAFEGLSKVSIMLLVFDPENPRNLYTITGAGKYVSDNGGTNWSLTEHFPNVESKPNGAGYHLPNPCSVLAVDPTDKANAYCGIETGVFITKDGGNSWELINPKVGWINSIVISPQDPNTIFAGGKGFAISSDGGRTWKAGNNGLGAVYFELLTDPIIDGKLYVHFVRDSNNKVVWDIYRSENGGQSWEIFNGGSRKDSQYGGLQPLNGGNFFISTDGTMYKFIDWHVWRSEDKGTLWDAFRRMPNSALYIVEHPKHPNIIYILAPDYMEVSLDNNQTWANSNLAIGGETRRLYFSDDDQVIYAVSNNDSAVSTDMGKNWSPCRAAYENYSTAETKFAVSPKDSRKLYVATFGQGIFVSDDGCASWRQSNDGLGNLYVNTIAIASNNPDTIYVGTDGGAYISFDDGQTWAQINNGLLGATVVYSIVVDKDSNVFAATPYGIFKLENK